MAYTSPKSWAFEETLGANTDTQLQVYSDNLPDLLSRFLFMNTPTTTADKMGFVHSGRWLFYYPLSASSQPKIQPYSTTIGDDVTLENSYSDGGGFVDLSSAVTWLVPGMYYYVSGISHASEMEVL